MAPEPNSRIFGKTPDGVKIYAWTLCGSGGVTLEIITYGATVTRLLAPDREGLLQDVVLGFDNLEGYVNHSAYFGSVVGRVAGRVSNAQFRLGGQIYELARNDPPNHLHGGLRGFDKRVWSAVPIQNSNGEPSLCMTLCSPDMEEGYPGNVEIAVTYTVTHDNVVQVETQGISDRTTPFSLTLHHYFNLGGEGSGSIEGHELTIHADEFIPTDWSMTLLGRAVPVIENKNDFRRPRVLGEMIPLLHHNHGDLYVVREIGESSNGMKPAARLVHPLSGRRLDVATTCTHLQLYTSHGLDGSLTGKSGTPYRRYSGVCLECEGYPNGANEPDLGNIILSPGSPRREVTRYAFSHA